MDKDEILIQLRGMETESRIRADIFKTAADLHEQGYKTDQARIDSEIEKAQATFSQTFIDQRDEIERLKQEKGEALGRVAELTEENAALKAPKEIEVPVVSE